MATEFHMISLARKGLLAALDEAESEQRFAMRYVNFDESGQLSAESAEAVATAAEAVRVATENLARFNSLHPEPVAA